MAEIYGIILNFADSHLLRTQITCTALALSHESPNQRSLTQNRLKHNLKSSFTHYR